MKFIESKDKKQYKIQSTKDPSTFSHQNKLRSSLQYSHGIKKNQEPQFMKYLSLTGILLGNTN